MKNLLLTLTLAACLLQGCNADKPVVEIDYVSTTYYKVENRIDMALTVNIVYAYQTDGTQLSRTVSILPGQVMEIDATYEMCGKNHVVREWAGDVLPIIFKNVSVDMYAGDDQVNGTIFDKENWTFTAEEYYDADYLLVVTDELIESAGYVL